MTAVSSPIRRTLRAQVRRHGTVTMYRRHQCRCTKCREAYRLYRKRGKRGAQPAALINAAGTSRRLQALAALGWSSEALAPYLACTASHVTWLRNAFGRRRLVHRDNAAAVAALFERLCATPGPSRRVRNYATRQGWAPPLLWDGINIDNPNTQPAKDEPTPLNPRRIDVDEIDYLGLTIDEAAALYRVDPESIRQARRRQQRRAQETGEAA